MTHARRLTHVALTHVAMTDRDGSGLDMSWLA